MSTPCGVTRIRKLWFGRVKEGGDSVVLTSLLTKSSFGLGIIPVSNNYKNIVFKNELTVLFKAVHMWICTAFSFLAPMICSLRVELNCIQILGMDDSVLSFFALNNRYVV